MRNVKRPHPTRLSPASCRLKADEPRQRQTLDDGRVRLALPEDLGHCYSEHLQLEPGLLLGYLHYHPTRPLIEESHGPHAGRVMVVTLGLRGVSGYVGDDASNLRFQAGHTTMTAFHALHGERRYERPEAVSQLRLVVHEAALNKYVGREHAAHILTGAGLHHLAFHPSSPTSTAHAAALLRHMQPAPDAPPPPRLELHIHALSLLAEQFNRLAPAIPAQSLSARDIARIEHARELMATQLHQPLTLGYLAAAVGINEHKLKAGFRKLYNTTPIHLLLELRMRKAWALLEAGQQVAQTGWQVGYRYPNNFSVAFARFFGRTPKTIFGKRCGSHALPNPPSHRTEKHHDPS